ncbi:MAG: fasciclin domain-containing protein, partial [Arthrobacter sp.]
MQTIKRTTFTVAGIAAAATLTLTACGGSTTAAPSSPAAASAPMASSMAPAPSASSAAAMDPAANLVGSGCAAYAAQVPSGAGSVAGMALDPVAVAASNNPVLTTLTAAVSGKLNPKVNLVDTLNGSEFTVFAPTDDAFAKIDPATIETLKTDDALLSKILTYHVVPGKISPDE